MDSHSLRVMCVEWKPHWFLTKQETTGEKIQSKVHIGASACFWTRRQYAYKSKVCMHFIANDHKNPMLSASFVD